MNKLFSKIAAASVGLAMAVGVGVVLGHKAESRVVRADSATIVPGDFSAVDGGSSGAAIGGTKGDITISATGTNTSDQFRVFKGKTMTISAPGKLISSIVITCTANGTTKQGPGCWGAGAPSGYTFESAGKHGTWEGSLEEVSFTATDNQVRITEFVITYAASESPSVVIDSKPTGNLQIGDKGTCVASSVNATNPSYVWSSSNSDVISITSAGAYEAKAYGDCTITVTLSCDEGTNVDSKSFDASVDAGLITIAQARTIIDGLSSGQTTGFKVSISGYVTSLNADNQEAGKERALNVSVGKVGSEGDTLLIFGVNTSSPIRNHAILNGAITLRGNLQKYVKSEVVTYEMTSPSEISYTDDAISYAHDSYEALATACATGPAAVTDDEWNDLKNAFDALDEYAQAKLAAATAEDANEDIAHWIDRYTRIVASGKANFMSNTSAAAIAMENDFSNNGSTIIIIIAATFAVTTFGAILLIRKKKHSK